MRALLKDDLLVLIPDPDDDRVATLRWMAAHADHAFVARPQGERGIVLRDLGPRVEACREPINVLSSSKDESIRLISNLAHTPFELDGRSYASIEGFWQGLKFPAEG
jgi:hypothetical protein